MGVFAILLLLMIGAVAMTLIARNQAKSALSKAALAKAEYNAHEGHRYLETGEYGSALMYYLRSLEYKDNLGAADRRRGGTVPVYARGDPPAAGTLSWTTWHSAMTAAVWPF